MRAFQSELASAALHGSAVSHGEASDRPRLPLRHPGNPAGHHAGEQGGLPSGTWIRASIATPSTVSDVQRPFLRRRHVGLRLLSRRYCGLRASTAGRTMGIRFEDCCHKARARRQSYLPAFLGAKKPLTSDMPISSIGERSRPTNSVAISAIYPEKYRPRQGTEVATQDSREVPAPKDVGAAAWHASVRVRRRPRSRPTRRQPK